MSTVLVRRRQVEPQSTSRTRGSGAARRQDLVTAGEEAAILLLEAVEVPSRRDQVAQVAGFDAAFSTRLQVDHGISHAIQYLVPDGVPSIPIVINVFAPPLPSLARCLAFGGALRDVLHGLPGDRRIAVIGTGGLSHQIPFPDWRAPEGEAEDFLAESFREGRGNWERYEAKRRPLIVGAPAQINTEFDETFLELFETGELHTAPQRWADDQLAATAGNGGTEIRAWLVMAAALGHAPGQHIAYSPMPEWLTGMAVGHIDPNPPTQYS